MTTNTTDAPTPMTDEVLDQINGGPHFRSFHGAAFDFQSGCDPVPLKEPGDIGRDVETLG